MVSLQALGGCIFLLCITSIVQGQLYKANLLRSGHYKIENVFDSNLKDALGSIGQNAWNVNHLDLSSNALSKIDSSDLSQFANLKVLNLSLNVLSETVDLSQLQQLQTLDLNNNYIQRVRVGRSVQNLFAVNNNITGVECVNNAITGKKLNLANNKINWLRDIGSTCRNGVEELNLELNDIDEINFDDLSGSRDTLKILNLAYNFIFNMKRSGNFVFTSLNTLDLSFNKIAFMSEVLNVAQKARTINLMNNKLVLIDSGLRLTAVTNLDMRGNEFQCKTLETYLGNHKNHVARPAETCDSKQQQKGGYCCENLNAPFADRLIALKRREQSLFIPRDAQKNREECERENSERQNRVKHILAQHRTQIDQRVFHEQEKVKLSSRKIELERVLAEKEGGIDSLKELLRSTASSLSLPNVSAEDTQKAMVDIVEYFERRNQEEQRKQSKAIQDVESSQQKIEKLLEDKAILDKQTADADKALKAANDTLVELTAKHDALSKFLAAQQAS
uniref:LRIM1/APL1C-like dimerization domain-containing protein n=1 Tax=Anopheles atroparvus TaxID=41427 RepID=A0AAG5D4P8_ANOAO